MSRAKVSDVAWAEAASRYPVGSVVKAGVAEVWPFGLVVDLPGAGPVGFVDYPNVDPAGTPVAPGSEGVPAAGATIEVVVLAQQPERRQLWLSCRLADFPAKG